MNKKTIAHIEKLENLSKEYKKELMNLYNDDVVLYLSDESTWYDLHDKV